MNNLIILFQLEWLWYEMFKPNPLGANYRLGPIPTREEFVFGWIKSLPFCTEHMNFWVPVLPDDWTHFLSNDTEELVVMK